MREYRTIDIRMPMDPFYDQMTVSFRIRKVLINMWPTFYNLFNGLLNLLLTALKEMIRTAVQAIKG